MREFKLLFKFYFLTFLCAAMPAHAALDIQITGAGEHQIPISIIPFLGEEKLPQSISAIVSADLVRSGLFRMVDPSGRSPHEPQEVVFTDWSGVDALSIGSVEMQTDSRITVKFRLLDAVRQTELVGQSVTAKNEQLRAIAHRVSDIIFEKLTGDPGVFSTRIVYVNKQGKNNRLMIADCDGYGEQAVLSTNSHIMSPSWSPDGSNIAYVAFEKNHAVVYVQSLQTNQRSVVANFRGSNSAPAWSPDGHQLAIVLTRDGEAHIYLVNADGTNLHQISFGDGIDTEPSFSPDGQYLIFDSDRGGSVQIYSMPVAGGVAERLTFEGGNNFSPRYSPDGKSFVFSNWHNGRFYISTEDFDTKQMQVLTDGGWEKKPSFAPNGKLILFAAEENGQGILETVSSDGRVKQKMIPQSGNIQDPMWGPLIK